MTSENSLAGRKNRENPPKIETRQPGEISPRRRYDTDTHVSEEFFICRKINYGNNGNFTRYAPVNPQSLDRKSFLMRLVKAWERWTIGI